MNKCRCCDIISPSVANEYILCKNCNSYNFFPTDDKNTEYFNDHEIIFLNGNEKENSKKVSIFNRFDRFSTNQSKKNNRHQLEIDKTISGEDKKILEIGFGNGSYLYHLLEKGIDAYGIDIADSLIGNFKNKYPKYADRVFAINDFNQTVDVVYNSAVFEHIPNPKEFLSNMYNILNRKGYLVLDNFPVIPIKKYYRCYTIENDISFWKHIHLIIYSEKGLEQLFEKSGFTVAKKHVFDNYRYRVFNEHLLQGYHIVERLRNFFWNYSGLPNVKEFRLICLKALFKHSKAFLGSYILQKNE